MENNVEKDTLELVLKEMLDEQKTANKINTDLVSAINQLTSKVNGFNEKLEKQKIMPPAMDIKPVQEIIKKGITDMELIAASQPKIAAKKFQILLFPEQDAKLFYKIVFGRWFLWLVIMLLLTNLYKWQVHDSDNKKEVQIKMIENNRIISAWSYLYKVLDKEGKKRMDSALIKAANRQ
jgi:hypothetical protein